MMLERFRINYNSRGDASALGARLPIAPGSDRGGGVMEYLQVAIRLLRSGCGLIDGRPASVFVGATGACKIQPRRQLSCRRAGGALPQDNVSNHLVPKPGTCQDFGRGLHDGPFSSCSGLLQAGAFTPLGGT